MLKAIFVLSVLSSAVTSSFGLSGVHQSRPATPSRSPLVVGWHDEMNSTAAWKPLSMENRPDIYAASSGMLTLRLPHVPDGFPYQFQWSGVTRSISADLALYPVLAARVASLAPGSYAHLDIEERDYFGHVAHTWRSPTLTQAGLTQIDLGKAIGSDVRRLTVRLIVGGKLEGAKGSYDWVRFVRREDLATLKSGAATQPVVSQEPSGDAPAPLSASELASQTPAPLEANPNSTSVASRRVEFLGKDIVANIDLPQQQMDFFIKTDSLSAPIVSMADNAGFPDVINLYARAKTVKGMRGVLVSLILQNRSLVPANAVFAINLLQPMMSGPCIVSKVELPIIGSSTNGF